MGPPQDGLAILVRKGLVHQPHTLPANPAGAAVGRLAVKVSYSKTESFTVINIYRPPTRAAADDHRDGNPHLATWPTSPGTVICADVNGHGSWDPAHDTDDIGVAVDEWLTDNRMLAVNSGEPTRIGEAGAGTAPDITVVHGSWASRTRWRVGNALGSDHLPLHIH